MKINQKTALSAMLGLAACIASAQPKAAHFVPFHRFLDSTRLTGLETLRSAGGRVKSEAALEEMRSHILNTYRDVQVSHSFVLGSSHFDCVPMMQQPAARAANIVAERPPESMISRPPAIGAEPAGGRRSPIALTERKVKADVFGNSLVCEDGTIPMRRITLEETAQFPSLGEFFQKGPDGAGQPVAADAPAADLSSHKYSRMYQTVDNLGGNANFNIWRPYVDQSAGQEFSLSQAWYLGGSGNNLQSAEVGWQNYPRHYGDQNSRLFIYWTADAYTKTGCYNLDCGVFFQVDNSIALGSDFGDAYSTPGGTQYEFSAQFFLYQGNWWLNIQGTWVGYYPGSIYQGGQLTRNAQQIQFGSESMGSTSWPGEGSGEFSANGFSRAAYQRNLFYFSTQGKAAWDTLTQWNTSKCYTVSGPFTYASPGWNVYFFEGGPGGGGC